MSARPLVIAIVAAVVLVGLALGGCGRTEASRPERDPALVAFCIDNLQRQRACLDDDAFWDVFATLRLTALGAPANPAAKKRAIGFMKDDLVRIGTGTRAAQAACQTMLRTSQTPSPRAMAAVAATRGHQGEGSCAEFANAYGAMIFVEGALRNPRVK